MVDVGVAGVIIVTGGTVRHMVDMASWGGTHSTSHAFYQVCFNMQCKKLTPKSLHLQKGFIPFNSQLA